MKGVTFGTIHSNTNFSLILSKKVIETPDPKTSFVEVEGSDGVVDLTEYFGEVNYENRQLKFTFSVVDSNYSTKFSELSNAIHGRLLKIIIDDDPNYYYMGRVYVDPWNSNPILQTIVVTCDCEPYKYKLNKTIVTTTVTATKTLSLTNLKKKVSPTFTTTASFTITLGSIVATYSAGTFIVPEIQLLEGTNSIKFDGTGSVTITYQERGF